MRIAAIFKLQKRRLIHKNAGFDPCDYQLQKEKIIFDITYYLDRRSYGRKNI